MKMMKKKQKKRKHLRSLLIDMYKQDYDHRKITEYLKDEKFVNVPLFSEEIDLLNERFGYVKRTKSPFNTSGITHSDSNHTDYISFEDIEDNFNSCSICCQNFDIGNNMVRMPDCGHIYHADCINRWLKIKVNCPYCRTNVRVNM